MRLTVERDVPHPPDVAWVLLTDPLQHDRWSRARMTLLHAPGDPGAVGVKRRITVRVGGLPIRLDEEIVDSERARRLVYQVVGSAAVRSHRGEILLSPRGPDGRPTCVRWTVDAAFLVPGLGPVVAHLLRHQLSASLDALASLPTSGATVDEEPVGQLLAHAEQALAAQRRIASELAATGAPGQWFSHVYAQVTAAQLGACRAGVFMHPDWALRLLIRFHEYYVTNLRSWRSGRRKEVEPHWRAAFEAAERGETVTDLVSGGVTLGLVESIRAHVDGDLPLALAEVYLDHYAGELEYRAFAEDYRRMEEIFPRVQRALMRKTPVTVRLLLAVMPERVRLAFGARLTYELPGRRSRAFRRGEQVATLISVLGRYRARPLLEAVVPTLAERRPVPDGPSTSSSPRFAGPVVASHATNTGIYDHLQALLEATDLHLSPQAADRPVTVLVHGPGALAVATETAHLVRRLREVDYPRLGPHAIQVVVADPDVALRNIPRALHRAVAVALERTGVGVTVATAGTAGRPSIGTPDLEIRADSDTSRLGSFLAVAAARWRARRHLLRARRAESNATVRWVTFSHGEIVVRQGDHGSSLYVVEDGEVEVIDETGPRPQLLAVLGPGQHFGERAVFDGYARTATVRARGDVRALVIERVHALTLSRAMPEFGDSVRQLPSGIAARTSDEPSAP